MADLKRIEAEADDFLAPPMFPKHWGKYKERKRSLNAKERRAIELQIRKLSDTASKKSQTVKGMGEQRQDKADYVEVVLQQIFPDPLVALIPRIKEYID